MKTKTKDFVGKPVLLTRPITTRGGKTYPEGSKFVVTGTWRGRYTLERNGVNNDPEQVRQIGLSSFKVDEKRLCFSCEKNPLKYIDGLCESCNAIARKVSDSLNSSR